MGSRRVTDVSENVFTIGIKARTKPTQSHGPSQDPSPKPNSGDLSIFNLCELVLPFDSALSLLINYFFHVKLNNTSAASFFHVGYSLVVGL